MARKLARFLIRMPALVAVLALLVMTTAGAAPGLFHGESLDHCCEFCHVGHASVLKPAPGIVFSAPPQLIACVTPAETSLGYEHPSDFSHARAPPA